MLSKNLTYLQLIRPVNVIFTFLVVWVSAVICGKDLIISLNIIMGALSAALVAAAGNVINDYYDINIDKINRPLRPIASGEISLKEALLFYLVLEFIALSISLSISVEAFLLVLITSLLLFFYSYKLKRIIIVSNLVVALCTALAFLYGGILVSNIYKDLGRNLYL